MKQLPYLGLVLGLAVIVLLLVWQGLEPVITLLLNSGWQLLWLPVVWLPGLLVGAFGWWYLFPENARPGWRAIVISTWHGHAVNNLLPVASVGGEVVRARLLQLWGYDGIEASASVIVDKTIQALSLLLWGLCGVGLLALLALDNRLAAAAFAGFLILAISILGFILVQRAGMLGFMARLAERLITHEFVDSLKTNALQVDISIRRMYKRRRNIARSTFWRTISLIMQTTEVWLGCYLLGHPISVAEALLLKSLTTTISDIAFVIPNGYGIQEGAYMVIGTLVGLSPEVSLALALAIRLRDLVIDLPGLLHWHSIESRQLISRRNRRTSGKQPPDKSRIR